MRRRSSRSAAPARELLYEEPSQTPLTPDELVGLKLDWVTTRADLNSAERANIEAADKWLRTRRRREPLDEGFLCELHKRMFGQVWTWAGTFRQTEKNLGVRVWEIGPSLRQLVGDARYWVEKQTYPPDELAARFHHRLVKIHPFPNGNGRHGRLSADLLLESLKAPPFSWGSGLELAREETRRRYIEAMRAADREDFDALFAFVRQ